MKPVEIPTDEIGDPVAINDRILIERERETMLIEAKLRRIHSED